MAYFVIVDGPRPNSDVYLAAPAFVQIRSLSSLEPNSLADRDRLLVDVDLADAKVIVQLKALLPTNPFLVSRVFVCDRLRGGQETQAIALGATRILTRPLDNELVAALFAQWAGEGDLASALKMPPARKTGAPAPPPPTVTLTESAGAIQAVFTALWRGGSVNSGEVITAASSLITNLSATKLSSWLGAVKAHHEATYQRMLTVAGLCASTGRALGLPEQQHSNLVVAGLLHDIGTARITSSILSRVETLTAVERVLYERHPQIAFEFLKERSSLPDEVLDAVLHHHECLNGSGFPGQLTASSLGLNARILSAISAFVWQMEAVGYRPERSPAAALGVLRMPAVTGRYDRRVLDAIEATLWA
jgi:HD-GYP domain-containing protein (c-di-GMP phosphodiesterase class II)